MDQKNKSIISDLSTKQISFLVSLCAGSILLLEFVYIQTQTNQEHFQFKKFNAKFVAPKTYNLSLNTACFQLINGSSVSIQKYNLYLKSNFRRSLLPASYSEITQNCSHYTHQFGYITKTFSEDERSFPLAFSILVYKHIEQVERLLRAIWRPSNLYCIHVDAKSDINFRRAVFDIVKCFSNVFATKHSLDVKWGTFTVLEAELICMHELWDKSLKWKYFINLTGQEYPLKTNHELTKILRAYNGANDISGTFKRANLERWKNKGNPPHKIKPRKGQVHIAAARDFVDYVLHNQTAKDLLKWVKRTQVPDETYFSTLNFNAHLRVPGSYTGEVDDGNYGGPWTRYKVWTSGAKCSGKVVRGICIFSIGDLSKLVKSKMLFANKFFYEYKFLAYDCLEAWYLEKVAEEENGKLDFNTLAYSDRWIVKHHF